MVAVIVVGLWINSPFKAYKPLTSRVYLMDGPPSTYRWFSPWLRGWPRAARVVSLTTRLVCLTWAIPCGGATPAWRCAQRTTCRKRASTRPFATIQRCSRELHVWIFFWGEGGWWLVLNSRVFSWRKRETRNAGACETLVQYIVYSLRAPQSTWPSRQLHANRNWYPHLWPGVFAAKFTKQKRAAPGVAFGDLWWLGQQMVGWRMANQRLLHCWTTLCHYEGRTALRPCHRTNEGHYLWRGFSVHQWYGHLVKDG